MTQAAHTGPYPSPEERELYKLYRDRINAEDTLVHDRLTRLLITQSILFGFCATSYFSREHLNRLGLVLLAVLGIVICVMVVVGIRAALATIDQLKAGYHHHCPEPHPKLPALTAEEKTPRRACWPPVYLPLCFAGGWLLVLLLAILTGPPPRG
jgi:hypothetical protein